MTYCERIKSFRYRLTTKFNIESVVTGIRHSVINVHCAIPVVLDVDIHYLARKQEMAILKLIAKKIDEKSIAHVLTPCSSISVSSKCWNNLIGFWNNI